MLLKLSKFFLYASVFSVLIVLTDTFFPFIGGKDYFFRACVELALIFFVLWWGFEAKKGEARELLQKIFSSPLFWAVSVFVLFFLLSVVFAYDTNAAFWSNYERGEGGFQMLHYYVFFTLLLLIFKDEKSWQSIFKFSLIVAVFMILYGVGAAFFITQPIHFVGPYSQPNGQPVAPTFLGRLFSEVRFQGSLGNPAYVAPYLMFAIFYAFYLWIRSEWAPKIKVTIYGILTLFFLLFFYLSQTRGAFLGMGAAVFAFFVYAGLSYRRWRLPSLLIILFSLLVFGTLVYYHNSGFVKNLPGGRLFDIAPFSDPSVQPRFWTWGSAWKGFLERPVFGWGPENFSAVFDKYFDPRHFIPGQNTETWFDRAHSVFLDYLAETGILGLLSYLGIFAVFYWQFFHQLRINADYTQTNADKFPHKSALSQRASVLQSALFLAMPVGYLVQGMVLFDVLPIYINLFIFLAFTVYKFGGVDRSS